MNETINIFEAGPIEGRLDVGELADSTETSAYVYDIAPGEASCPYHYEYVEEWLLVVTGEAVIRTPDGERTIARGGLVRFPAGPGGAHKVANRGELPCRVLMFSRQSTPAVSIYPDSDKIGVWPGGDGTDAGFFVRSTGVSWSHGEDGWHAA